MLCQLPVQGGFVAHGLEMGDQRRVTRARAHDDASRLFISRARNAQTVGNAHRSPWSIRRSCTSRCRPSVPGVALARFEPNSIGTGPLNCDLIPLNGPVPNTVRLNCCFEARCRQQTERRQVYLGGSNGKWLTRWQAAIHQRAASSATDHRR